MSSPYISSYKKPQARHFPASTSTQDVKPKKPAIPLSKPGFPKAKPNAAPAASSNSELGFKAASDVEQKTTSQPAASSLFPNSQKPQFSTAQYEEKRDELIHLINIELNFISNKNRKQEFLGKVAQFNSLFDDALTSESPIPERNLPYFLKRYEAIFNEVTKEVAR